MSKLVSAIIPVYNEQKDISDCLDSLEKQTYKPIEVIVVDDGSTDKTLDILSSFRPTSFKLIVLKQHHAGPGVARNYGAEKSSGEILIFIDADMTFDKNFLRDITLPILQGKTIGTFSKNEVVKNHDNIWSICWNINKNLPPDRMLPKNYPDKAPVFRSILREKFDEVGGFDETGEYTDDWSLSRKLKVRSTVVDGAIYYHKNPPTLKEVWQQARWIGKSEFISGTFLRKIRSLVKYNLLASLIIGIYKSVLSNQPSFIIFKLIYDQAIFISVIKSFFGESKSK